MANILDAIPAIGKILDDVISTPEEKREAQIRLRELDIREIEAKSQAQSSWMNNQSLFVSGAIPSILWMVVIVVFFNYILSPLVTAIFGVTVPVLDLPDWYSDMCSTIILGLFTKKAWDNADFQIGKFNKRPVWADDENSNNQCSSMNEIDDRYDDKLSSTPALKSYKNKKIASSNKKNSSTPVISNTDNDTVNEDTDDNDSTVSTNETPNYDDPDYINRRLAEMSAAIDKKHKK